MINKKTAYIIGGLALFGVVYFLYKNNKKTQSSKTDEKEDVSTETKEVQKWELGVPIVQSNIVAKKSVESPKELSKKEIRKENRSDKKKYKSDCGKRPLLKKNRVKWQECVDKMKSGAYGFDGYISHSNFNEIADFTNEIDI